MEKFFDINGLKEEQLKILLLFHEYCVKNHLSYCLAYGTLIGAIRHKGYIPWDDDIDVIMPRKDYEKLIDQFNRNRIDEYKVIAHENDPSYYLPFAKIVNTNTVMQEEVNSDYKIGIYVDVFPLDSLSDNGKVAKALMKKAVHYNKLLTIKNLGQSLFLWDRWYPR